MQHRANFNKLKWLKLTFCKNIISKIQEKIQFTILMRIARKFQQGRVIMNQQSEKYLKSIILMIIIIKYL